jgi:hypothetical protein
VFTRDAVKDLATAEEQIRELVEKRTALDDKVGRIDIRSPESGTVHEMKVYTIGGVIRPSETLMTIIPRNDKLIIEARASPTDVDQLGVGLPAVVRFVNFNQRITPELRAKVTLVSADVAVDQGAPNASASTSLVPRSAAAAPYYAVRMELLDGEVAKLGGAKLVPGMQVQTFITTGERTVMSISQSPSWTAFNMRCGKGSLRARQATGGTSPLARRRTNPLRDHGEAVPVSLWRCAALPAEPGSSLPPAELQAHVHDTRQSNLVTEVMGLGGMACVSSCASRPSSRSNALAVREPRACVHRGRPEFAAPAFRAVAPSPDKDG